MLSSPLKTAVLHFFTKIFFKCNTFYNLEGFLVFKSAMKLLESKMFLGRSVACFSTGVARIKILYSPS